MISNNLFHDTKSEAITFNTVTREYFENILTGEKCSLVRSKPAILTDAYFDTTSFPSVRFSR